MSKLRQDLAWTQDELAHRSGYSSRLIRKLESGANVRRRTLQDVLACFAEAGQGVEAVSEYLLSTSDQNVVDLAIQWFQRVWNERDLGAIKDLVDPNVILHAEGTTREGRKIIEERVGTMLAAFDPLELTVEQCFADGDTAVIYWQVRKKHVGDFAGITATHRWVNIKGSSMARFRDGRIVEARDHLDVDDLIRQLQCEEPRTF